VHEPGPLVVPNWFSPQQLTVPFESSAQVMSSPTEMAVTPARPVTARGVEELVVVPLPSSP
jgi:hypothetical protein